MPVLCLYSQALCGNPVRSHKNCTRTAPQWLTCSHLFKDGLLYDFYITTPRAKLSTHEHLENTVKPCSKHRTNVLWPFLVTPAHLSQYHCIQWLHLHLDCTSEPCPSTLSMNQITLSCSLFGYWITSISPRLEHYPSLFTLLKLAFNWFT